MASLYYNNTRNSYIKYRNYSQIVLAETAVVARTTTRYQYIIVITNDFHE